MPVPFKVKAVYEYRSEEPDDLSFDNGQIITVIEDDDADWYTGEYADAQGQKVEGIFPRNFVEKYEPAIPTRPTRAPRKVPQPEHAPEPEPPVAATQIIPPPAHDVSKEAEIEPPRSFTDPEQEPVQAPAPASKVQEQPPPTGLTAEVKVPSAKKQPPPVVEKPSSFKDRIAAFNKPAAAPVAPFKPGSGGTGFIKKPFVAPPPSRNAYVPPLRDPPAATVYRREEELETERQEPEAHSGPVPALEREAPAQEEENQPKTETLKERIARLQQQQLENAQKQAGPTHKKEKPKRPIQARTESAEAPADTIDEGVSLERVPTEKGRREIIPSEDEPVPRTSTEERAAATPPPPSRELVSDTNDADDSGAGDTEDAQDISTEEERQQARSVKSPPMAAAKPEPSAELEEDEEDTEEEEDPEIRRRRELRERMAKMSGGMGMMGMFGGGSGGSAPASRKPRAPKEETLPEPAHEEETTRAPPVPLMALPGMSNMNQTSRSAPRLESDEEPDSAQPTPVAAQETAPIEDDYVSQKPSRSSTQRSEHMSPRDRAPPPLPADRPEPPQSPGTRPVPPPPPPTRYGDLPTRPRIGDEDEEEEEPATSTFSKPPPIANVSAPRSVPPVPSTAGQAPPTGDTPRGVPPIPVSPTSPQARPPPPPPPGQAPPRRTTIDSSLHEPLREDSEDEVTEYDGDYDTDIASSAKHKKALKSHNRDSSMDEGALSDDGGADLASSTRAAPPPVPTTVPRDVPPPPPLSSRPRESVEAPRAPPPVPPPQMAPRPRESLDSPRIAAPPVPPPQMGMDQDEYDPYRYQPQQSSGLPGMIASMRKPTEEFDDESQEERDQVPPPPGRTAPPLPPTERAVPPPTSSQQMPMHQEPEAFSMSGALSAPNRSIELGRSNSRRSAEVSRPSMDQGFIAADVDLAQGSQWWTRESNPPPILQGRNDVLWEIESSTTQKRGGRASVSRDVYVLYADYSQTTINATYDASEPSHVSFEQNHERPPMPPRKDQLENASEQFGAVIAKNAEKANGNTVGEGSAPEFVLSLIKPLPAALLPVGTRAYGALVYANLANASTQQFDEIRPGDIITFRNAKFAGHKGGLHQKYSQEVGNHVGVVIDWDGTKRKIRAWEQGNQEKGKKAKVREESYRVSDLKSGEVRVWRVMPRSYVNWGTA